MKKNVELTPEMIEACPLHSKKRDHYWPDGEGCHCELGKIRRRKVANVRNSFMNVPLEWHDWSNWWTDGHQDSDPAQSSLYLHVQGNAAADPTGEYGLDERVFRVYPKGRQKGSPAPRISMIDGELYWLLTDKPLRPRMD